MRYARLARRLLAGRTAIAIAALGSAAGLGAASLILVPDQSETAQATVRAGDAENARRLADKLGGRDAATQMLRANAYLTAGQPARALALLMPLRTRFPDDATVAALLSRAASAAGSSGALLTALHAQARRTDLPGDLRALRIAAVAAQAPQFERFALERLAIGDRATGPEIERLAQIEEQDGSATAARLRLTRRFGAGGTLSTPTLQHLLQSALATDAADVLVPMVAALHARGAAPSWQTVVDDLSAGGRFTVARTVLERALTAQPDPRTAAPLWRRRAELAHRTGDDAAAHALLRTAIAQPGTVPPADLIQIAYLLDAPVAIIEAAEHRAITRPTPALALDLARRVERLDPALIGRIDRVAGDGWRRGDPWLAIRLAERQGDRAGALRFAALLPDADAASEAILTRSGDKAAVRALLLARAQSRPNTRRMTAERLLSLGFRDDAVAILAQTPITSPDDPAVARLLYLWGPRPPAAGIAWLHARIDASGGDAGQRMRWLQLYAARDRPSAALRTLEADAMAARTPVLIARLTLANGVGDRAAGDRALRALLDGRVLEQAQIAAMTASTQTDADPALRSAVARARIASGAPLAHDRLDLAWSAWQRGDGTSARCLLTEQLAIEPDNRAALGLMADIAAKAGGPRQAEPWLRRALAASPGDSAETAALLGRLGRNDAALAMIARLRSDAPADRKLVAAQARYLIAAGRPGRAQALFKQ